MGSDLHVNEEQGSARTGDGGLRGAAANQQPRLCLAFVNQPALRRGVFSGGEQLLGLSGSHQHCTRCSHQLGVD